LVLVLAALIAGCADQQTAPTESSNPELASGSTNGTLQINVALKGKATTGQLAQLGQLGTVTGQLTEINAVFMRVKAGQLDAVRALPFVAAAGVDAERKAKPIASELPQDFAGGLSTWDQDAVNVTDFKSGRTISYDGSGVWVGILDTGLLPT